MATLLEFGRMLWGYLNDVGYTPDGTDMTKACNLGVQR
jgi:hypothetical protein